MAELIPIAEISVLKPASEVKEVADEAVRLHEEAAVARLINLAANAGEHVAIWEHPMSDALKTVLEGQGYKITRVRRAANPDFLHQITGF